MKAGSSIRLINYIDIKVTRGEKIAAALFFCFSLAILGNHPFGLINPLRDLDPSRAGPGTFKMVLAGPHAIGLIQYGKAVFKTVIPGIGQEPEGLGNVCRAQKSRVFSQYGAGGKTGRAQDTIGCVIKGHAFFLGLNPFLFRYRLIINKKGLYGAIFLKKSGLINNQISLNREMGQGINAYCIPILFNHVLYQCFTGQAVFAVDAHGVGTADPMGTALSKPQRTILKSLDLHQRIQDTVRGFNLYGIALIGGLFIRLRIESMHFQYDLHHELLHP